MKLNIGKLLGAAAKALVKAAKPIVVAAIISAASDVATKKLGKPKD